jgi:hypothetical protein
MKKYNNKHQFCPDFANQHGIPEALIYQSIQDIAHEHSHVYTEFYEGLYWVQITYETMNRHFHYISPSRLKSALESLISKGLVKRKNLNVTSIPEVFHYTVRDNESDLKELEKIYLNFI